MSHHPEDIAIIGMACLLPGAKDRDAYWDNILSLRSFVQDGPDEWAQGTFDETAPEPERIYTRKVALLGSLAEFDPVEFGVVPNAIPSTEPDHFLALKLAAAALKDSGYADRQFDRSFSLTVTVMHDNGLDLDGNVGDRKAGRPHASSLGDRHRVVAAGQPVHILRSSQ